MQVREKTTAMNPFHVTRRQNSGSDSDDAGQAHDQRIVIPAELVSIAETIEKKEGSRFVTSQIPTDLTVQVHDITFHVHKYPLLSRCGYLNRLNRQPSDSKCGHDLKLDSFPGGPETFETVLKFCYGLPIDLTPANVASLRCASEFLEMTEDLEEGNLISKTEAFLTFAVLSSWRDSIAVLKSCASLSPWAENLQIVRRCSDAIAWKASRDHSEVGHHDEQWWFDDVSALRINHFVRVLTAVKAKGVGPETIGACIMKYAEKWLPGFDGEVGYGNGRHPLQLSILSGRRQKVGGSNNNSSNNNSHSVSSDGSNKDRRMVVESLVSMLPPHKEAVSCGFLLWMLKMAIVFSATPVLIMELEKRAGIVLEDATVTDLLIPNYINGDGGAVRNSPSSSLGDECSMYNVDVVQRIVEYFLMHDQQQKSSKISVGKLLDGYFAEIATDPRLSITKFQHLAETLPANARTCDDGLYRAIDTYLKTHPSLTEHERRRLCRVMDCQKLSIDACAHATQNERLPIRTVMQVLFTEQMKMRETITVRDPITNEAFSEQESTRSSTKKEIKSLKAELEKTKIIISELQRDYTELLREFDKFSRHKSGLGWSSRWKKIKASALLFHGKDIEENGEMQPKSKGPCSQSRRVSIS